MTRPEEPIPGRRVLIITYGCTVPTPSRARQAREKAAEALASFSNEIGLVD